MSKKVTIQFERRKDLLGLPNGLYPYVQPSQGHSVKFEIEGINEVFLELIQSNSFPEIIGKESIDIDFINYGDTELVYVLTKDNDPSKQYAILVNQPPIPFGTVEKEYNNLIKLNQKHPEVVAPLFYFHNADKTRELYIMNYYHQSRCIGCDFHGWGIWIPEPYYRFQTNKPENNKIINACMIALLIEFYDEDEKLGVAACKIGGGDFMLEKGFENEEINYTNIVKRMKLIGCREFIHIELDDYIELIRKEFTKSTYYKTFKERDPSILINHKCRIGMNSNDIEDGIKLGLELRKH